MSLPTARSTRCSLRPESTVLPGISAPRAESWAIRCVASPAVLPPTIQNTVSPVFDRSSLLRASDASWFVLRSQCQTQIVLSEANAGSSKSRSHNHTWRHVTGLCLSGQRHLIPSVCVAGQARLDDGDHRRLRDESVPTIDG